MIHWVTKEINALKFEYYLVVSRDENCHRTDLVIQFVTNCLRLYRLSARFGQMLPSSERRPGDDAAILAAMGLIRLMKLGRRPALIQCISVLETLLQYSQHNYDAILVLVRLYLFLGTGSLAIDHYSELSIKNLQNATISWVLFTRISTIHPHVNDGLANRQKRSATDIGDEALHILKWHHTAQEVANKSMRQMQDGGRWSMLLDSLATCRSVELGFTHYSIAVEANRIARLRSPKSEVFIWPRLST